MTPNLVADQVLINGHVIDPANDIDAPAEVAIADGKIAAVGADLGALPRKRTIDVRGGVICPGLIDLHVHCFAWMTPFGLKADDVGINAGCTTIVDQGSVGAWTFGGFLEYVIRPSKTDIRSFLSINLAGALQGGMRGDVLHNPSMVDLDEQVRVAQGHPDIIRGFKCHGESGALSNWGTDVLKLAVEAGNRADLPLYCHTGELFPINLDNQPHPQDVVRQVVSVLRPGDTLAHIYSGAPDGIMSGHEDVPEVVFQAVAKGLHFDIGYGVNFRFDIARKMIAAGVLPNTISSDAHGAFAGFYDDTELDYSLCGAMTRLLALGIPLKEIIRRVTVHPARILRDAEIGTLSVGTRADVTVLERVKERRVLTDGFATRAELVAEEQLVPRLVIRRGEVIEPTRRYLPDLAVRNDAGYASVA
jgi:dihydroorotase